jgi:hypothetical protein
MVKRKMRIALVAVAVCAVSCADGGPRPVAERRFDPVPAPRGEALLRARMLAGHNSARAALRQPALGWNPALARDAAAYAAELARTRRFAHSPQPRGNPVQGENLWKGTRGAYRFDEMVGHWVAEKKVFKRGPAPRNATTGRFEDVGHYTQIIWRGTTQLGCAIAANKAEEYLVCRYLPAGNVAGVDPLGS